MAIDYTSRIPKFEKAIAFGAPIDETLGGIPAAEQPEVSEEESKMFEQMLNEMNETPDPRLDQQMGRNLNARSPLENLMDRGTIPKPRTPAPRMVNPYRREAPEAPRR